MAVMVIMTVEVVMIMQLLLILLASCVQRSVQAVIQPLTVTFTHDHLVLKIWSFSFSLILVGFLPLAPRLQWLRGSVFFFACYFFFHSASRVVFMSCHVPLKKKDSNNLAVRICVLEEGGGGLVCKVRKCKVCSKFVDEVWEVKFRGHTWLKRFIKGYFFSNFWSWNSLLFVLIFAQRLFTKTVWYERKSNISWSRLSHDHI